MATATRADVEMVVLDELQDHFGVVKGAITDDTDLAEDLCADSLDLIELIMAAEEEFGITLIESEVLPLTRVGDLVDHIWGRICDYKA